MSHPISLKTPPSQALDFMRGLALLGMLISQAQTYSLVAFLRPHQVFALPLDQADTHTPTQFFVALLVNGPAESLFSVGFGWSFYRLWQLGQQAGLEADRILRRQLWALLGLGLLHGWGGWSGELLHQYALLGFSLLYFTKQSVSTLLKWIAGLVGLVVMIQVMAFLVAAPTPALAASGRPVNALLCQLVHTWSAGSWQQVLALQPLALLMGPGRALQQGLTSYVHIEILLLGGVLAGKLHGLDRRAELRVRLSLLLVFLFPLAIGLKGVSSLSVVELPRLPARWQYYQPLLFSVCDFLGTPLLTLVYLLEIGLNLRPRPHRVVVWISQVGQMSLTNYLLQSGLSMFLFYEDGLALSGKLSLLASVGVVGVVYGFELWFSHWWLSQYRQGPLEQLLSRWSTGKAGSRMSAPLSLL